MCYFKTLMATFFAILWNIQYFSVPKSKKENAAW